MHSFLALRATTAFLVPTRCTFRQSRCFGIAGGDGGSDSIDTVVESAPIDIDVVDVVDALDQVDSVMPIDASTEPAQALMSRGKFFQTAALSLAIAGSAAFVETSVSIMATPTNNNTLSNKSTKGAPLAPVNFTTVYKETSLTVTVDRIRSCVFLDPATLQKKEAIKLPSWLPTFLVPPPRVIKDVPDREVLLAAISAGAIVEMARTLLLYPLASITHRVQTDINRRQRKQNKRLRLKRRLRVLRLNAQRHFKEGDLCAGVLPSLLVAVPATGVYYGVRDITKRMLLSSTISPVGVSVLSATLASVASITVRTPVDALATRLQVASGRIQDDETDSEEERDEAIQEEVGDWFSESIERLPALILTELPYLLSRIALNGYLISGKLDLGHYEVIAISTAILIGILTTPFDVARTRILIDSDDDPDNGIDGGSGEALLTTFETIINESDDGVANLYRGWLERALYLGIGRGWLEPLQIVAYIAIRDTILLEFFD